MAEHIAQNWRMKKIRYSLQIASDLTATEIGILHDSGLGLAQIAEMTREELVEACARLTAEKIPSAFLPFIAELSVE